MRHVSSKALIRALARSSLRLILVGQALLLLTGCQLRVVGSAAESSSDVTPRVISLELDGGAAYTNSTSIVVVTVASNASEMYVTFDPTCDSGGVWTPYAISMPAILSTSNATSTIYTRVR